MKEIYPARIIFIFCLVLFSSMQAQETMQYRDVFALPVDSNKIRLSYGPDSLQFGDLRLPEGEGPHKVVVIIHGGCWVSAIADLSFMDAMASELPKEGYATWNIEYRSIGNPGGTWPNTFLDVAKAVNHLRKIADKHKLDLDHIVLTGHSAGGHLALWQALQTRLPKSSEVYLPDPLPISGVVSLAGIVDLSTYLVRQSGSCGSNVSQLMGGFPEEYPQRYAEGSPIELLPAKVPTILITGKQDPIVPLTHVQPYYDKAQSLGNDMVYNIPIDRAGHFEVISPGSIAWPEVLTAINKLISRSAQD